MTTDKQPKPKENEKTTIRLSGNVRSHQRVEQKVPEARVLDMLNDRSAFESVFRSL